MESKSAATAIEPEASTVYVAQALPAASTFAFEYRLGFWQRFWIRRDMIGRRRRLWIGFLVLSALLINLFFTIVNRAQIDSLEGYLLGALPEIFVFIPIFLGFSYVSALFVVLLEQVFMRSWRGRHRVVFAEDGIYSESADGTIHVDWQAVRRVWQTKRNVFFVYAVTTLSIPAAAFGSHKRRREAMDFAEARTGWARAGNTRPSIQENKPESAYAPPGSMSADVLGIPTHVIIPERGAHVVARAVIHFNRRRYLMSMASSIVMNPRLLLMNFVPPLLMFAVSGDLELPFFILLLTVVMLAVRFLTAANRAERLRAGYANIVDFTEEGLWSWVPAQDSRILWDRVPSCVERKDELVVKAPSGAISLIPLASLERPEDLPALRALLARRLGARARMRS